MRSFVIPDIHGCFLSLKHLVEKLQLQKEDKLYFLGDYVNKGPDSKGVIDFIHQLQQSYTVVCLRGNHEQLLIDALSSSEKEQEFLDRGGNPTLLSFQVGSVKDIPKYYFEWLNSLPYYYQLPKFILVHAGFNFGLSDYLFDKQAMLNIRSYIVNTVKVEGRVVIHGHAPHKLDEIKSNLIEVNNGHVSLDNGCVYPERVGMGNLIALDIDSKEIYIQPNVDFT